MLSNIASKKATDFISELLDVGAKAASQYDQEAFNAVFESLINESVEECDEDDLVKACLFPSVYANIYRSATSLNIIHRLCYDSDDLDFGDKIFNAFLHSVDYLESILK